MTLTITDDAISGEHTSHTARRAPGHPEAWEVSWLPGRPVTRNAAITAMLLADIGAPGTRHPGARLCPHIQGWAAELGLTAPDALARIARPPGSINAGRDHAAHADPEAAD